MGDKAKGKNKRKSTGTDTNAAKAPKAAKDQLRPHEQRQQAQAGR
jgi:hypothetical protein